MKLTGISHFLLRIRHAFEHYVDINIDIDIDINVLEIISLMLS